MDSYYYEENSSDPIVFFAQRQYDMGGDSGIGFRPVPIRQSQLASWLGVSQAPKTTPKAEVPGAGAGSAVGQQATQNMQDTYAQYAQQLAAMQGGMGGQGQMPQAPQQTGPSIWDFINQGVANAPTSPSMSPYGQAPVSPYGQMANFNPYGTNAPGAGAMFGPTGTAQVGQP